MDNTGLHRININKLFAYNDFGMGNGGESFPAEEINNNFDTQGSGEHKFNFPKKKIFKIGLLAALAALLIWGGTKTVSLIAQKWPFGKDSKVEVKAASAVQDINREFTFPLKDSKNKEVGSIKYTIEKAELRDEILIKGQKYQSVKGRVFLIITLKIENQFSKAIEMDTRDYVRVAVAGKEEWLAPTIHNDPVEVQAISVQSARVGLPINEGDRNLTLSIGEINGAKEQINIAF